MRHAARLLCVLIACGSLALGCAPEYVPLPPAPLPRPLPDCPAPARPLLPLFDGTLPFDAPVNLEVLLRRDDVVRLYVKGLEAALNCWKREKGSVYVH